MHVCINLLPGLIFLSGSLMLDIKLLWRQASWPRLEIYLFYYIVEEEELRGSVPKLHPYYSRITLSAAWVVPGCWGARNTLYAVHCHCLPCVYLLISTLVATKVRVDKLSFLGFHIYTAGIISIS